MKKYEKPLFELETISLEDVVLASIAPEASWTGSVDVSVGYGDI